MGGWIGHAKSSLVRVGKKYKTMNARKTTMPSNAATNLVKREIRSPESEVDIGPRFLFSLSNGKRQRPRTKIDERMTELIAA
jgi:hypothetical protein